MKKCNTPQNQIPLSPLESSKSLNISDLDDFSLETGTKPGQTISLYRALMELYKEKKMSLFQPIPYIDYQPAKLAEGKECYIYFSVRNPETGKMKRFKRKLNKYHSARERRQVAKILCSEINMRLALGWNPLSDAGGSLILNKFNDVLDDFITVKSKEMEANSLRSYKSYVNHLKDFLDKRECPDTFPVQKFSKELAKSIMNELDSNPKISARTFNNYRAFFIILFNWIIEKGYIKDNPFIDTPKKAKRLTKKHRRLFTDQELNELIAFLERENPRYLAACMLCYCCFVRPKEICLLKGADIDLRRQVVYIRSEIAKNDCDSCRTIPDEAVCYLKILEGCPQDHYLFSELHTFSSGKHLLCSRELARYWNNTVRAKLGYPMELQFYSLKDTGITRMAESGMPLNFVQQQADHSSLEMTSIYIGMSGKATDEIRKASILPQTKV